MNIQHFINHGVINDIHDCPVVNVSTTGDVKMTGETPEEAAPKALSEDDRILGALTTMKTEGVLRKQYDYAFVMELMNETSGLPSFNSAQSFITYLQELGMEGKLSVYSIKKQISRRAYWGHFPDWHFDDCDGTETQRRVNIGKRFLSAYRKG